MQNCKSVHSDFRRMNRTMIPIRLCRTYQALQGITGGRHARRPCFDFGTSTYRGLDSPRDGQLRDVTCLVGKGLARLVSPGGTRLFFRDIGTARESIFAMALNKLSIDKVELADKRVLIRYVYSSLRSLRENKTAKNQ